MNKTKDFMALIRFPLGVMASISGFAAGFAVIRLQHPDYTILYFLQLYWLNIIIGIPIPFLIVCASMAINDYYDYPADRANNRKDRPLTRNVFTRNFALYTALIMFLLGATLSVFLINVGPVQNNYWVVFFALLFIGISISYSTWLKKNGFLGKIGVASSNPAAINQAGFVVGFDKTEILVVIVAFGFLIFFTALGREVLKGVMDMEGDKQAGVKTISIRYGPKNAARITLLFFIIGLLFSPFPIIYGLIGSPLSATIYAIAVVAMAIMNFKAGISLIMTPTKEVGIKGRKENKLAFWFVVIGFLISAITIGI